MGGNGKKVANSFMSRQCVVSIRVTVSIRLLYIGMDLSLSLRLSLRHLLPSRLLLLLSINVLQRTHAQDDARNGYKFRG